jgi:hypothetical protein
MRSACACAMRAAQARRAAREARDTQCGALLIFR